MKYLRGLIFILALALAGNTVLVAAYLPAGVPDANALLCPPPVAGSAEDKLDLENTSAVHRAATPAEIALGQDQNKLTIYHYAPAIGAWFTAGKFPQTDALFKAVETEAKAASDSAKKYFKRPRPYHVAPERFPHAIEHEDPTHYSYPSGHSTRGTLFALLLAEIFPDRREAILAKGREAGWLRVQGGVHYPTDIYAGRVLGQELFRDFLRSPEFQAGFAAVKIELLAAATK